MRKLQVNTTGAWRNVLDFDEVNEYLVTHHAAELFSCCPGAKLRVMGDDASSTAPLMTWSAERGWAKWRDTP